MAEQTLLLYDLVALLAIYASWQLATLILRQRHEKRMAEVRDDG